MDPGISLFGGGAGNIQLDANAQSREEEEEALEDQRRRDQELKNLLTTAFADLTDEEEEDGDDHSSVGSSYRNEVAGHGHSNLGSLGSSHDSPSDYYSYSHGQTQTQTQTSSGNHVQQFANSATTSTAAQNHIYDPSQGYATNSHDTGVHNIYNYQTSPVVNGVTAHHTFASAYDTGGFQHESEIHRDSDNFGYLSTIPQTEFTTNGDLLSGAHLYNNVNPDEDLYRNSDLNSQEQLMVLYGARMREVTQLTDEIESLRRERDTEVEQLKRKLMLLEAEKQGAFLSHKEAQSLLVENKTQISNLNKEIEELRLHNITLQKAKEELARELEVAKASASDLVQKVAILERNGNGLQPEKQMESFFKTVQQRHDSQLQELQTQLDSLTTKFSKKDHECSVLEQKLRDLKRLHESLLVEKGETVNELVEQLDEAQKRLRQATSSSDGEEALKLKVQLEQALSDRKSLEEKLRATSLKLEAVEKDLQQYETVTKMGLLSNGDSSFESDSIAHLNISRRQSLSGHNDRTEDGSKDSTRRSSRSNRDRDDLNAKLRDELQRALQGQRSKREEIRRLQEEVTARDRKIRKMKEQEKIYFDEAEKFKTNLTAVLDRLKRQEEEAKTLRGHSSELSSATLQVQKLQQERDALENELKDTKLQLVKFRTEQESLKAQLAEAELKIDESRLKQVDQASSEFLAFHDESIARVRQESSRQLEAQVVDFRVRMEQAQKECEEVKRLYIEVCSAKRAILTQLKEEEGRVKQLTSDLNDAKEAQQSIEELHRQERDLNRRMRADLEKEREKSSRASVEKEEQLEAKVTDRISALQKEHEQRVQDLENARQEAVARADRLQDKVSAVEKDSQRLQELEKECTHLRNEALEAPRRQQVELERISRELKHSRERVVQLEKRLRAEFETQMNAITTERDSIQAQLKQKDLQLEEYLQALSRIRPPTCEASTNTSAVNDYGYERLRQTFDEKIAALESQHQAALKNQVADHQATLASAEEQVKEETVRYFAEEISRLEEKHRNELGCLARKMVETETTFAKHLTSMKNALQSKSSEVEVLEKKISKLEECSLIPRNEIVSEDAQQLHQRIETLQKQMDSDRNKMAETMSQWASEVQDLRARETEAAGKLEELQTKYKTAKKAAVHYKHLSVEKEKHMMKEWQRLESGYREALNRVQAKVNDIVGGREQEVADHLQRIESHYEAQMKALASKLNQKAALS